MTLNKSTTIYCKAGNAYHLRLINADDGDALGRFFEQLKAATRLRFGPHPLTADYAKSFCEKIKHEPNLINAFVIEAVMSSKHNQSKQTSNIVGYVITDSDLKKYPHDVNRYADYGVNLNAGKHWVFAPCIADALQSSGLATAALTVIKQKATQLAISSLILMGGTQTSNSQAVAFYKKNRFKTLGAFKTEVDNIDMHLEITN
ncbi:GNAT family N-acetyltransferase [Algibacillus agarilyticus]|uniref:GNAT family N-acetyltransferase n=1 Tax=Algibacillus agarilyticus TaxID=2234133 RepID=UPI000DD06F55|nr:GNAT family N-acetyltransferase [Algibacillus agarilyticus]